MGRSPSGRVVESYSVRGKMNLNSFMMKAFIPTDGMRKGQKFFNFLHEVRPDLADYEMSDLSIRTIYSVSF